MGRDQGGSTGSHDQSNEDAEAALQALGPLKAGEKFDEEGTGWGWRQVGAVDGKDTVLPTTCKMERP